MNHIEELSELKSYIDQYIYYLVRQAEFNCNFWYYGRYLGIWWQSPENTMPTFEQYKNLDFNV